MIIVGEDIQQRFFAKTRWVLLNGIWHLEWIGHRSNSGHGMFRWVKMIGSHVMAFIMHFGRRPINQCLHVLRCSLPYCVWWRHLYDGTPKQNVSDCFDVGNHRNLHQWGKNNPMYGRIRSGIDAPNYGKTFSEEVRERMSHSQRKLSDEVVAQVPSLYAKLGSQQRVADALGVSQGWVGHILRNKYLYQRL